MNDDYIWRKIVGHSRHHKNTRAISGSSLKIAHVLGCTFCEMLDSQLLSHWNVSQTVIRGPVIGKRHAGPTLRQIAGHVNVSHSVIMWLLKNIVRRAKPFWQKTDFTSYGTHWVHLISPFIIAKGGSKAQDAEFRVSLWTSVFRMAACESVVLSEYPAWLISTDIV